MKFIKLALFSFLILFLIITAIGLLLPSTVRVTRSISLPAPRDTLHRYINDVKYWKLWMAGAKDGTLTFLSSQTAGAGTKALVGGQHVALTNTNDTTVTTVWASKNGRFQTGVFQLYGDSTSQSTTLNWYFEQRLHWYPWERISAIANDKILGPGMEQSLDNLKAIFQYPNP